MRMIRTFSLRFFGRPGHWDTYIDKDEQDQSDSDRCGTYRGMKAVE